MLADNQAAILRNTFSETHIANYKIAFLKDGKTDETAHVLLIWDNQASNVSIGSWWIRLRGTFGIGTFRPNVNFDSGILGFHKVPAGITFHQV